MCVCVCVCVCVEIYVCRVWVCVGEREREGGTWYTGLSAEKKKENKIKIIFWKKEIRRKKGKKK